MHIENYGIILSSLVADDIEMVRKWRNLPHVKAAMIFQETISAKMQEEWFKNLTENDRYFIISVNMHAIGVVHVKNIDWKAKSGEAGIFIGEEDYLKTLYPIAAVLAMMDTFFIDLKFDELTATVRNENTEILEFNQQLGYVTVGSDERSTKLMVDRTSYLKSTEKLRALLCKM